MIKNIYNSSNTPLYLLLFISAYLLNFTDLEFVTTEEIYNAYQQDRIVEKYGDDYTDEFLEDLEDDYEEPTTSEFLGDLVFDAIFVFIDTVRIPYLTFFLLICFELLLHIPNIRYLKLFKTVIVAEFVFIVQTLIQQVYLLVFKPDYTMEDIIYSKPLALGSLLGESTPESGLLSYLIEYADLFKVAYIFLIAYGIATIYVVRFSKVIGWVFVAYIASQLFYQLLSILIFDVIL
uniref:hypothetical protein n=1 Tax=Roseivirga sp. TaxID=1964215 RepID=UPI00404759C9